MNQTVQGVPLKELLHLLKPSCFPCLELQSTVWSRSIECLAPPALLFLAEDEPSSPTLTKGGSLCGAALAILPWAPGHNHNTEKPDPAQYEQDTDGDIVQGQNNLVTCCREENPMELEVTT